MKKAGPTLSVVHLDDDPNDLLLFQQAVAYAETPFLVRPFLTPDKAITYLKAAQSSILPPSLLLCDYDFGLIRAPQILPTIRAQPFAAFLPIVVLSGSVGETAIADCYNAGANYFLRKPLSLSRLQIIAATLYKCCCVSDCAALAELEECRRCPVAT